MSSELIGLLFASKNLRKNPERVNDVVLGCFDVQKVKIPSFRMLHYQHSRILCLEAKKVTNFAAVSGCQT